MSRFHLVGSYLMTEVLKCPGESCLLVHHSLVVVMALDATECEFYYYGEILGCVETN